MSGYNANNETLHPPQKRRLPRPIEIPGLIWFYGLWIVLAMGSATLGHSSISTTGAFFLLGGIVSTNFFFLSIAYSERRSAGLARLLAYYQTIMAIAWTSAYFYFSTGAGDLVLGMYMTALMFAVTHLGTRKLVKLGAGVLISYLLIFGIKYLTLPALVTPLEDTLRFVVLAAVTVWVYVFARKLRELRFDMQYQNEELQSVVERVTKIAEEDHLTKSYNRRYIMDVLGRERARADRSGHTFSVLLFDLDHFKRVNDEYGHLVGDQILSDFARRVKGELRGIDSVSPTEYTRSFGRFGGEEFIAILPGSELAGARQVAERIRKVIGNHPFRDQYSITVSVGVAEYRHSETVPQLLTRADEALYRAKREGRNQVRCSRKESERPEGKKPNLRVLK